MTENDSLSERFPSEETHRVHFWRCGFPPTGYVGYSRFPSNLERDAALSHAFAAFNRGSGEEVRFDGPSASVGDVFIIEKGAVRGERTLDAYRIKPSGFEAVDFPPIVEALGNGEVPPEKLARQQRDLDAHDRMIARAAAEAARDALHDNGPGRASGEYTVHEARDRAAHTPALTREPEK
jgi:hypothetical protein